VTLGFWDARQLYEGKPDVRVDPTTRGVSHRIHPIAPVQTDFNL
jgi:hypothetical protein